MEGMVRMESRTPAGATNVMSQYSLFQFVMIFDHFKQVLDCWGSVRKEASQLPSLLKRLVTGSTPAPF